MTSNNNVKIRIGLETNKKKDLKNKIVYNVVNAVENQEKKKKEIA